MPPLRYLSLIVSVVLATALVASPAMAAKPVYKITSATITAGVPWLYEGAVAECVVGATVSYQADGNRAKWIAIQGSDASSGYVYASLPIEDDGTAVLDVGNARVPVYEGDPAPLITWTVTMYPKNGRPLDVAALGTYQYVAGQCPTFGTTLGSYTAP